MVNELRQALELANLEIKKYNPEKQWPVYTARGKMTVPKFYERLRDILGKRMMEMPGLLKASFDIEPFREALLEFAKEENLLEEGKRDVEVPPELAGLTLNVDMAHPGQHPKFFLTTGNEIVSPISGTLYTKILQLNEVDAVALARKVMPEYMPRRPFGISSRKDEFGHVYDVLNVYTPPPWTRVTCKLPDRLPDLFLKLVKHLFPLKIEREYFFSWLHASLFDRAFVYLILCGAPGTGKNRLKLVMRALHGHQNTVDGKKSTLTEKFNSQLSDATLAWFDELKYNEDMENNMKEIQNDSISIERKGVDATRATNIHASLVVSNNKPRDNFLSFDARKFAPLVITGQRLEKSMAEEEIDALTGKTEKWSTETYDLKFLAQIGRWIKKWGGANKWPNTEYKGPMFYTLAHTSMLRWQKKAAVLLITHKSLTSSKIVRDEKRGYLWSSVEAASLRKHGDKSLQFPDFTSVQYFFDIFRDADGRQAFSTSLVEGDLLGDFFVKPLFDDVKITSETKVLKEREARDDDDKEEYDL